MENNTCTECGSTNTVVNVNMVECLDCDTEKENNQREYQL